MDAWQYNLNLLDPVDLHLGFVYFGIFWTFSFFSLRTDSGSYLSHFPLYSLIYNNLDGLYFQAYSWSRTDDWSSSADWLGIADWSKTDDWLSTLDWSIDADWPRTADWQRTAD